MTAADTYIVGLADARRRLDLAGRAQLLQDLVERIAAKKQRAHAAQASPGTVREPIHS